MSRYLINKIIKIIFKPIFFIYFNITYLSYIFWYKKVDIKLSKQLSNYLKKNNTKNVVIFASFEKRVDDPYIKYISKNIDKNIFQILIINNSNKKNFKLIHNQEFLYINRPNFGRDFGAYKLAINSISDPKLNIDNLILLNDTVFYVNEELIKNLFSYINLKYYKGQYLEHTKDTEINHFRSYFLKFCGFSNEHQDIISFFKDYKLSNSRVSTIKYGELFLSKKVLNFKEIELQNFFLSEEFLSSNLYKKLIKIYKSKKNIFQNTKASNNDYKSIGDLYNNKVKLFLPSPYNIINQVIFETLIFIKKELYFRNVINSEDLISFITSTNLDKSLKSYVFNLIYLHQNKNKFMNKLKLFLGEL